MIELIHEDCIKAMDELIEKGIKVDAIITDLPYGTSACKWDEIIPFTEMWERINQLIERHTPIILFGNEPFSSKLRTSNLKMYKYDWKWEKSQGANFLNFKYQPAKVHEDIMVFGIGATSYSPKGNLNYFPQMEEGKAYTQKSGKQKQTTNNSTVRSKIEQVVTVNKGERYPRSIQHFPLDSSKLHPTQKPVSLMEYLILTYTKEGDLVLDFTMGSGSTAIACINTKRNFIGIEKDADIFNIAKDRVDTALAQI